MGWVRVSLVCSMWKVRVAAWTAIGRIQAAGTGRPSCTRTTASSAGTTEASSAAPTAHQVRAHQHLSNEKQFSQKEHFINF